MLCNWQELKYLYVYLPVSFFLSFSLCIYIFISSSKFWSLYAAVMRNMKATWLYLRYVFVTFFLNSVLQAMVREGGHFYEKLWDFNVGTGVTIWEEEDSFGESQMCFICSTNHCFKFKVGMLFWGAHTWVPKINSWGHNCVYMRMFIEYPQPQEPLTNGIVMSSSPVLVLVFSSCIWEGRAVTCRWS